MQYQGIDDQRVVNIGLQPIAKDLGPAARRHQRRPLPEELRLQAARRPAVHRHRQDGQRHRAAAVSRRSVLPEDRRGDGGGLPGLPGRAAATRCGSPSAATSTCRARTNHLPNFDVPAGFTLDDYFEHVVREGFAQRLPRLQGARGARRRCKHTIDEYERRLDLRNRHDQADEVPGYFLIVWDFIRYAREQGIPVGPGRGSAAGSFVAYCLRITDVDPIEYDLHLRALPQPRARVAARHRHRLLRAAARRSHRVRHAEVRPRERRADHHLRDDEGARRRPRRRAASWTSRTPTPTASPRRSRRRST